MPLENETIETLLNKQIQMHLSDKVTYNTLRSECLAVSPVQSVLNAVSSILVRLASEDNTAATLRLTQEAQEAQLQRDKEEERTDARNVSNIQHEKRSLENKISNLKMKLFAENIFYLAQEALHIRANKKLQNAQEKVRLLEHQINHLMNNGHQPTHHHEHHHHEHSNNQHAPNPRLKTLQLELTNERRHVARLHENERKAHAIYFQHQTNINQFENGITNAESKIRELSDQQTKINVRQQERNKRESARASSFNEPLSRKALSDSASSELDRQIQSNHSKTNQLTHNKINQAESRCYRAFLNQLVLQMDTLSLEENEKTALKAITTIMQQHLTDRQYQQDQEGKLTALGASWTLKKAEHKNMESRRNENIARNQTLVNENEMLCSKIYSLTTVHEKRLAQRDFYATCSLAGVGVVGVGAITAYFLIQAGVMALMPGVNLIVAAVAGVALIGLLIATGVAAVRASFTQSEINDCQQKIENNNNEKERNNRTMHQAESTDLPTLVNQIQSLEKDIEKQRAVTQEACLTATASITAARQIEVSPPSVGNNSQGFFPSTPPDMEMPAAQNPLYQPST